MLGGGAHVVFRVSVFLGIQTVGRRWGCGFGLTSDSPCSLARRGELDSVAVFYVCVSYLGTK
jgi:hypothetical protein